VTDDAPDTTDGTTAIGNGSLHASGVAGRLSWGLCSQAGPVRAHNEDFAGALVPAEGTAPGRAPVFVVADGLGGHAAGEVASRIAVETVLSRWTAGPGDDAAKALRACVRDANSAVVGASYEKGRAGMGSTLTVLTIAGRDALIAHVGDSRAYLVRRDSCVQLTNDHSRVGEMVRMKLITPDRAAKHPARSQLTRSLGATLTLQVDLARQPIEVDDTFVLCSDGLWDEVARSEISQVVGAAGPDAGTAADQLVAMAVERGAVDNVTAVVVRIVSRNDPSSDESRRSLFRRRQ
jgi:protein phosphatase